jgi:UDPglucose 6-dehydrogenase
MRISVVGLGKLGAPLAAMLADRGHDVVGVDNRADVVSAINDGRAPVDEPGLEALIASARGRLRATTDGTAAAAATDVSFIIVPTPSLPSGLFSTQHMLDAISRIGEGIRAKTSYHLVVVTSTVAPGTMERDIAPALERASGRVIGTLLGLCYSPEFIALGSVIQDMCNPDFVLIGESDAYAGDMLEAAHRSVVGEHTVMRRMNLVNAEVAKIAVNTFVTTKISYANMLSELCERLPGADANVVTETIGFDKRIGHRFFKAALGYGGPCFPRDNAAFVAVARACGVDAALAAATDLVNRRQVSRLASLVKAQLQGTDRRVAILGLSYKPDTDVVEESQGIMLANRLASDGYGVTVFDPVALENAATFLAASVHSARSAAECLTSADVAVVTVPWSEFRDIPAMLVSMESRPRVVVDCWRIIDPAAMDAATRLVHVGTGAAIEQTLTALPSTRFARLGQAPMLQNDDR